VTHYQHDSCTGAWLRELAAIREEETRPHLKWAGGRLVTIFAGDAAVVTTTYGRARELLEEPA
jgi:hypothetical protein